MSAQENRLLDRIAAAWDDEADRWLYRDATWMTENKGRAGHEVCRCDDSGYAGEFSEVHRFKTRDDAERALERLRGRACARRAIGLVAAPSPVSARE